MNRRNVIHLSMLAVLSLGLLNPPKQALAQDLEVAGKPITATSIIWEECWEKKVFGKKVKACARLLEQSNKFYIELEIAGKRKKWEVAKKCYESDKISIGVVEAWLKVCLDPTFDGGQLKKVKVTAHICGKSFGQSKCWKVYEDTINFFYLRGAKSGPPSGYLTASEEAEAEDSE